MKEETLKLALEALQSHGLLEACAVCHAMSGQASQCGLTLRTLGRAVPKPASLALE